MRKDPDQRWASMDELGRAMAQWLLNHDTADDITGVSLQTTWLESPTRASVDPLESMRPPAMESGLDEVSLGMPAAPSFRAAPGSRRRFGALSRRHVWVRHPLVLAAFIGLMGALLVVIVLKVTSGSETTVRPALTRVREMAQNAFAKPAEPAAPEASAGAADEAAPTADQENQDPSQAAVEETKPNAVTNPTAKKRAAPKRPAVNKLKNPFQN